MNELVALVSNKTGLSLEMAEMAVVLILDYLEENLPVPIAGRIDPVLAGVEAAPVAGQLSWGRSGFFGQK